MIAKNNSYFDLELITNGHYIITGMTNDTFISENLVTTDVVGELHRYLMHEQGFDAVFFVDRENMVFCLDEESFDILNGVSREGRGNALSAEGPIGRRRARTASPEPTATSSGNRALNLGRRSMAATWQQVSAVMRNTDKKIALVIKNAGIIEGGEDYLHELVGFGGRNQCVVIYMFRETNLANVSEAANNYLRNILIPRIEAEDPGANRVISLGSPNSKEVSLLLNKLRLDKDSNVSVRPGDIPQLGVILAASCSRNKWGLKNLMNRLEAFSVAHPDEELCLENWHLYTGEINYKTPAQELEEMIGQANIKQQLISWMDYHGGKENKDITPVSASRFCPLPSVNNRIGHMLNVVLKGAPGTGKTTIARIISRLYYEAGLLPQGHLVECSAADLVSGYVGHTAEQVRRLIQDSVGGVLFIDEAYSLLSTHGREAINQLVADMSRYEGQFAVVLAGYANDLDELMRANDGLARRFPVEYTLEDYSPAELKAIFLKMVADDPEDIRISEELEERLDDFFESFVGGAAEDWGNAGEAQTLLVKMKRAHNLRRPDEGGEMVLCSEDVPEDLRYCLAPRSKSIDEAMERLDSMIGLKGVKAFIRNHVQNILTGEKAGAVNVNKNLVFMGNPGTGKTTVCREVGELFGLIGLLRRKHNNVVEVSADELMRGNKELRALVRRSRGGVLFIDEAHHLNNGSAEGRNVIDELVTIVEDPEIRLDTCFVLAGYRYEIQKLLDSEAGLRRRFPEQNHINFADYNAEELCGILKMMAEQRGLVPSEEYLKRSRRALEKYLRHRPADFGNGGFIRDNYLPCSIVSKSKRLCEKVTGSRDSVPNAEQIAALSAKDLVTLTADDLPEDMGLLAGPVGRYHRSGDDPGALDSLIGKQKIIDFAKAVADGDENGFYDADLRRGLNYAVIGPNGCGKHTAIRAVADFWCKKRILEEDRVICASKGDFEAGYIGQTKGKTREVLERAERGTLIIDQPSEMIPVDNNERSFGPDALNEIAAALADQRMDRSLVVVESPEGFEKLMKYMPSIKSSLRVIELEDLTPDQMFSLFRQKTADSFEFEKAVENLLPDFVVNWVTSRGDRPESWGNGMEIDHLLDMLCAEWTKTKETVEESVCEDGYTWCLRKRLIRKEHFAELQKYLKPSSSIANEAMARLQALPGLTRVKKTIEGVERRVRRLKKCRPGCYLYLGNPGVGKTTVAGLMGGVLKASGVIKHGHVVSMTARQISEQVRDFEKILHRAKNGILFIDEAPQLAERGNYWGNEVIKKLLTALEDEEVVRSTCIILAGYPAPLLNMINNSDEGLQSRFGAEDSHVFFDDYSAAELLEIMDYMAERADQISAIGCNTKLKLSPEFRQASLRVFEAVLAQRDNNLGNARYVRNYLHDALNAQLKRFDEEYGVDGEPLVSEADLLTEADIPERYRKLLSAVRREKAVVKRDELNTVSGGPIEEENYAEACDDLQSGVVLLELWKDGARSGFGSGVIVSADGKVLTCAHVVSGADKIRARVNCPGAVGGDTRWFDAQVMDPISTDCDMAILKLVNGKNFKPVPVRTDGGIVNGEKTLMLGYPLGDMLAGDVESIGVSNFSGRVASVQQSDSGVRRVFIDSTGLHGNSGSPVFSMQDGKMIGIFAGSIIPDRDSSLSLDELNFFHEAGYFLERYVEGHDEQQ